MSRRPRGRAASSRGALPELAGRLGVLPEYTSQTGARCTASDESRIAALAAMGIDAADERVARASLEALEALERRRLIAPAVVHPRPAARGQNAPAPILSAMLPRDWPRTIAWSADIVTEDGAVHRLEGRAHRDAEGTVRARLPAALPLGYHTLRFRAAAGGAEREGEQLLVITPGRCPGAADVLRGERAWGLTANLYSVRRTGDWGVGDCTALAELVRWTASAGGAFVGVNPLHAVRGRGLDVSPYSPLSRIYRDPVYLDVEAVPELSASEEARRLMADRSFVARRDELRARPRIDHEAVRAAQRRILEPLHRAFRAGSTGAERQAAYARFVAREGRALVDFATFCALDEHYAAAGAWGWPGWPAALQDAGSAAVARFREENAEAVSFHQWLQFELDRQLASAADAGRRAGLPIGLYQDLAIGSSPTGADVWARGDLFVRRVAIGAPPDPLAPQGQNWGLPPIDPRRLLDDRFAYWIALVRAAFRHAGALRIDHVLGLFRQFWIPQGMDGADGVYVRFPAESLLGILALESTRAGALVVGEDLGTVPPEVPPALRRWGVLSSTVLYFERERDGGFRPAAAYPRESLATANTHDLPTLAAFWSGADIELRRALRLLTARTRAAAARGRRAERQQLVARLTTDGLLPPGNAAPTASALRAGVHAFLRRTPSWLVGLALDDLAGEIEPVNVPGVGGADFPNWTRRMHAPLDTLLRSGDVWRALGYERRWAPGEPAPEARCAVPPAGPPASGAR